MENKNSDPTGNTPTLPTPPLGNEVLGQPIAQADESLGLENAGRSAELTTGSQSPPRPLRRRLPWLRLARYTVIGVAAACLLFIVFVRNSSNQNPQQQNLGIEQRFDTQDLPLSELKKEEAKPLPVNTIKVNGTLEVSDGLALTPGIQPATTTAGQLYYDQSSNLLGYYNGSRFVMLSGAQPAVTSLDGVSGDLTLGPGLIQNAGQLSNNGVLAIGGQSGNLTLGNGLIAVNGQLRNTGILNVISGNSSIAVANDGSGNVTISGATSPGGTVSSPGGTPGKIAKFTGAQTIADSLLGESGTTVVVSGDLNVSGSLATGVALGVASGGTGATSLSTNGVLVGQGTGAITSVTAGGAGLCLVSTAGPPIWQACPGGGGGGVDSLNGLTGALTLGDSSSLGSTITINDASTSAKGIARFNSANFTSSGGDINTIQDINTTAAPTFGSLTVTSGAINGQTISNAANFTGTITVAGLASFSGDANISGTLTANTLTPNSALTIGASGQSFTLQGDSSSTLTATNGGNVTSFTFQAPTANVTYRLLTAADGTYDICTTAGNCSTAGGVTTVGGSTNQLAKFTGAQTIADSIISDNGTTVNIAGILAVNTIMPTGALTIGSVAQALVLQGTTTSLTATNGGFTNQLTFAVPGGSNKTVTIPNASGTIAVSAAGPIQLDTNGNITCPLCVTSGGGGGGQGAVDSLNGLTGAITLANATGAGSTITLDNASTSTKGIAQFDSTNFTVTGGVVNTIQNINTTAAPTFGSLTVTSGTINGQTISNAAGFTGTLGVAGLASLNGGASVIGTLTANTITPTAALTIGATGQSFTLQGNALSTITATNGANTTSLVFQSPSANVAYRLPTASAGTYDICSTAGNCIGLGGGITGSGTSGRIAKFNGSNTITDSLLSESGSTVTASGNVNVTAGNQYQINGSQISSANLSNDSNLAKLSNSQTFTGDTTTFRNGSDSASAFSIQNTAGNNVFNVDTSSNAITLGNVTTTVGQGIAGALRFADGTNDNFGLTLNTTTLTADRVVSLPNENGTVCLQSSGSCGFAVGSAADYVQNQSSNDQTANFRISGTGRANTSFITPVLDTASAVSLDIGSTASGINLHKGTTITGALTQSGGAIGMTGSTSSSIATTSGSLTLQSQNAQNRLLINGSTINLETADSGSITIGRSGTSTVRIGASTNNARSIYIGEPTATNAQTVSIGGLGSSTVTVQGGTGSNAVAIHAAAGGSIALNTSGAGKINITTTNGMSIAAGAIPTGDLLSISNAGQAVTTAGTEGLSLNYVGGAAAVESSGMRIDLTPGGTSGGTWSGMRIVANGTGAASGVNEYGLKLEGPSTPGVGTETAVNVTSGWDIGMNISSGGLQLASQSTPNAPAVNTLRIYAQNFAGKPMLALRDPDGAAYAAQPGLFQKSITMIRPSGGDVADTRPFGFGDAAEAIWDTSSLERGQDRGWTFEVGTDNVAGAAAGVGESYDKWRRGNTTGSNGFFAVGRVFFPETYTQSRIWVGLTSSPASTAWFTGDDPAGHRAGFSYVNNNGGRQDTNWQFTTKNGTTQSLQNTSMAFAADKMYDMYVYCPPQSSTIYWRIDNLTDGTTQEGSTSSNLPGATTDLRMTTQIVTIDTTVKWMDFGGIYVEADK